ncbi:cupin domain-containing protein [Paenibacillus psychroresistens]|uniref:Cupin domain-containing protein n=1 Tax=Paenibacillus psychroresistens TaxID=1778678 RepID=A0A6B8RMG1_9BACL|nr:sugar phosphate nucleotidyltransferase [Paenibacillus psychroresistens]QGQ97219.1 cupin domain-containing protein [Paenibacillus psychroresistens]
MKLVLLSGGSGKRLWPLSNDSRSKQFLKVLENPEGELESMVQRVWRQLAAVDLTDSTYLATNRSQVEMIHNQLDADVPVIVEPERRDTFPAIALAASYLYSMDSVSLDTVVAILPVDSYVDEVYFQTVQQLEQVLHETNANIALIGVVPNYPAEKYGYIVPNGPEFSVAGKSETKYLEVSHFREKPNKEQAELLIQKNSLWNCGVFAFRLQYLIDFMIAKGLPIHYEELCKQYKLLTKISFDYEVVEKADNVVVVPYDGIWKDLGTWNTLTEEMRNHQMGSGIVTEDCDNTHLINELDIPVTVIGATNLVIVASPDGILVSHKAESPRIKEVLNHIDSRPMYEERRWGHYRVIDYMKYIEGNEVLTKRIFIHAGKNISYHYHNKRSEIWTMINGEATVIINEKSYQVRAGDVVRIPEGTKHSIFADSDVEFIEVQSGMELVEEDVVRICLEWKQIALHQFIG